MSAPSPVEEGSSFSGANQARPEVDDAFRMAKVFFHAATKLSENNEDILPQEDGEGMKLSVFSVFASLFPDTVGTSGGGVKNKRMRLHFNKIGYQMYGKEQSRRVPSLRAKPGNPGYGFRRARWRDALSDSEDRTHCQTVLRAAGCSEDKISQVMACVQECRHLWDAVRRPSRPAGPGRPRRIDGSPYGGPSKSPKTTATPAPRAEEEKADREPRQSSPSDSEESKKPPTGAVLPPADVGPPPLVSELVEMPSPGLKRPRESDLAVSAGMLILKKKGPLLTPPFDGKGGALASSPGKASMLADLTLPPLALPPMARNPSMQPLGSLEAEMARPPSAASGVGPAALKTGFGVGGVPSLSALEFLAHAAAEAAEEQRQLIPLARIVHP